MPIRSSVWKTDIPQEVDSKFASEKFDKEGQSELHQKQPKICWIWEYSSALLDGLDIFSLNNTFFDKKQMLLKSI